MADRQKNKVVFRRIRGRVIPIKVRRQKRTQGLAQLTGGTALTAAGGLAFGEGTKRARRARISRQFSRNVDLFGDKDAQTAFKRLTAKSELSFGASKALGKIGKFTAIGLGGALIGKGLENISESVTGKKSTQAQEIGFSVVGTGAFLGAAALGVRSGKSKALVKAFNKFRKR